MDDGRHDEQARDEDGPPSLPPLPPSPPILSSIRSPGSLYINAPSWQSSNSPARMCRPSCIYVPRTARSPPHRCDNCSDADEAKVHLRPRLAVASPLRIEQQHAARPFRPGKPLDALHPGKLPRVI